MFFVLKKRTLISFIFITLLFVMCFIGFGQTSAAQVYFGNALRKVPIYKVDTEEKAVALTFDAAWGADKTRSIIVILNRYEITATFFLVGFWIEKYPDEVKLLSDNGIEIGNHSNNHLKMSTLSEEEIKKEIVSVNEKLTEMLAAIHPKYKFFTKTDEQHLSDEWAMFCEAVSCAQEYISLSTHAFEDKKQCAPSAYFLQMAKNPIYVEKNEESSAKLYKNSAAAVQKSTKIINDDEILKLNPSAISTYLKCPKKYYFKGLLNLKEQSTFAANYGNIVHAVMEVFLSKYLDSFNKSAMLVLSDILFNSVEDSETTLQAGFSQLIIDLVAATEKLALAQMRMNFEDAIEELDKNGWFNCAPEKAFCEISFSFRAPELGGVVFDGRIDAMLEKNGEYSIVDFKTGKNKDNDLNYALSEYGVNFFTKTGRTPANIEDYQKKYDYQIPIYYLASQNSASLKDFKGKVTKLGLEYVRPKNIHGGCKSDFAPADTVETFKYKIS